MKASERKVLEYRGVYKEIYKSVLIEEELDLIFNDSQIRLNCTMENVEDFIVGYLFTNSLINSFDDIKYFNIDKNKVIVKASKSEKYIKNKSKIAISTKEILNSIDTFNSTSNLFKKTRSAHSCGLYQGDKIVIFREDIGRHNALDKVIGAILRENINLDNSFIYISGRLPLVMVEKLTKVGINIVISLAKPTDLAINYGIKNNLTIIGDTRKADGFTVYTGFENIIK